MSDSPCSNHADQLRRIESTVADIHRRLFQDNGQPCIQTRIDRHDQAIGVLRWLAGTAAAAAIAVVVKLILAP